MTRSRPICFEQSPGEEGRAAARRFTARILAIEAEAIEPLLALVRAPRDAGIDAALLAEALHEMEGPGKHSRPRFTRQLCPGPDYHIKDAEKVAAEYARLRAAEARRGE